MQYRLEPERKLCRLEISRSYVWAFEWKRSIALFDFNAAKRFIRARIFSKLGLNRLEINYEWR